MRLTRSLEERLVNLYRQTKVVGGLFRSLGQEADAVGSAYALDAPRHPLAAHPQPRLDAREGRDARRDPEAVHGEGRLADARPRAQHPLRRHGARVHRPDLAARRHGSRDGRRDADFKLRGEQRVGLVYVGDGATSTGAFHEGINFAAVQRCPLVVDRREQRLRVLDADREADARRRSSSTRRRATASPASRRTATT